jgi:two-component system cell cycle response regulator
VTDGPVEIGDGVWWVGKRLADDTFQCHAYFIENGDESVLLDPGSPLTIEATLAKVEQIASLDSIKYLVCHHPDPDIAASLPYLSERLTRDDVVVVTEWRARALLKHYGHRFSYYLVEEHGWTIPLGAGRALQFQFTPYLHFPGAMVSYDTRTSTLFSSDLFGGFVPDSSVLVSHDLDYIIENATPFHQHYMPSTQLLVAGLTRIQRRWPIIRLIAPQHGHLIATEIVQAAFEGLKSLECGVFTLADADLDLKRLLRISEAKVRITEALLTIAEPATLVAAINAILAGTHEARDCALYVDLPGDGWTMWGREFKKPILRSPDPDWPMIDLPGSPAAVLSIHTTDNDHPDEDLMRMLHDMAPTMRPAVDGFIARVIGERDAALAHAAAMTDSLTGLGNRRALEARRPTGTYALISLDIDFFKYINDTYGHAAGDEVLRKVSAVLTRFIRDYDAAYRLGGDEFLIVLPDAGETPAVRISERIRATVKTLEFEHVPAKEQITLSIGVNAAVGRLGGEFEQELAFTDAAMYESKHAGRDRVSAYHRVVVPES